VFYKGKDSVKAKFATHTREPVKKIIIGHDVWIGQYALIKQGITVGTGAVIGMGSVVTKDVKPYTLVAGSPAKIIKKRFDDKTILGLLKSEWWNFSEKQLHKLGEFFNSPGAFLENIRK